MMIRTGLCIQALLVIVLLGTFLVPVTAAGTGCDGCKRDAVLKKAAGLDMHDFTSILAEHATSPCFHLIYSGEINEPGAHSKWKPPEYYFTANYETNLKGRIKSRLRISLYFEDGELLHNWKTESDRPTVTWHWHLNNMFKNPDAVFRKSVPLELTLLNDFEKQPSSCEIQLEKNLLFPGQETTVKISGFVDIEGRKSREFNRIIVQAVKGEIIGGTPLVSDPDLKAFQVGQGEITFRYVAPDETASQVAEDQIRVYNSCDILRKDEYPMEKTGLRDKIAEQKMELVHADAVMTITQKMVQKLGGAEITWNATEKVVLKYEDTLFDEDEGTFTEYYDVKSWKLTDISATKIDHDNNFKEETAQAEQDDSGPSSVSIIFDSRTGKAIKIELPHLGFWFLFHDEIRSRLPGETFGMFEDIKGGDGIHQIAGEGVETVGSVTYKEKWRIKRYRAK
jgi:hypothetical protein